MEKCGENGRARKRSLQETNLAFTFVTVQSAQRWRRFQFDGHMSDIWLQMPDHNNHDSRAKSSIAQRTTKTGRTVVSMLYLVGGVLRSCATLRAKHEKRGHDTNNALWPWPELGSQEL